MRLGASPRTKWYSAHKGSPHYTLPLYYRDNFGKHDNIIKLAKDNPIITAVENKTQINVTNAHVKRDNSDAYK